jgi:hypothetical protein
MPVLEGCAGARKAGCGLNQTQYLILVYRISKYSVPVEKSTGSGLVDSVIVVVLGYCYKATPGSLSPACVEISFPVET